MKQCEEEGFDKFPLGHMINRPSRHKKQVSNCRPYYQLSTGLVFLKAAKNMDTERRWVELFFSYGDSRIGRK